MWTREMQDGSTVVAIFNRDDHPKSITTEWSKFGVTKASKARNLWTHQKVTLSGDAYTVTVPMHGVVLLQVGKER